MVAIWELSSRARNRNLISNERTTKGLFPFRLLWSMHKPSSPLSNPMQALTSYLGFCSPSNLTPWRTPFPLRNVGHVRVPDFQSRKMKRRQFALSGGVAKAKNTTKEGGEKRGRGRASFTWKIESTHWSHTRQLISRGQLTRAQNGAEVMIRFNGPRTIQTCLHQKPVRPESETTYAGRRRKRKKFDSNMEDL